MYEDEYAHPEQINFSKIHENLRSLALFDDTFLNMQAMNLAIIDKFITEQEYLLLQEYIEKEKTPLQQSLFVSAQSQMWMFATYELLRTWRSKCDKLLKWKQNGSIDLILSNLDQDRLNLAANIQRQHLERLRDDPEFTAKIRSDRYASDNLFTLVRDIRVTLAKHQLPGKDNKLPRAPGYGRIHALCGALDFEVEYSDGSITFINRRDIANELRRMEV